MTSQIEPLMSAQLGGQIFGLAVVNGQIVTMQLLGQSQWVMVSGTPPFLAKYMPTFLEHAQAHIMLEQQALIRKMEQARAAAAEAEAAEKQPDEPKPNGRDRHRKRDREATPIIQTKDGALGDH